MPTLNASFAHCMARQAADPDSPASECDHRLQYAVVLVQECEELIGEMKKEMGTFWLYNIYDTCAADQATLRTFDHWWVPAQHLQLRLHLCFSSTLTCCNAQQYSTCPADNAT